MLAWYTWFVMRCFNDVLNFSNNIHFLLRHDSITSAVIDCAIFFLRKIKCIGKHLCAVCVFALHGFSVSAQVRDFKVVLDSKKTWRQDFIFNIVAAQSAPFISAVCKVSGGINSNETWTQYYYRSLDLLFLSLWWVNIKDQKKNLHPL